MPGILPFSGGSPGPRNRGVESRAPTIVVYDSAYYNTWMTDLVVRRAGNSLALILPSPLVKDLKLHEGDHIHATLEKAPRLDEFFGVLKEKVSAEELNRISNEGEDLG